MQDDELYELLRPLNVNPGPRSGSVLPSAADYFGDPNCDACKRSQGFGGCVDHRKRHGHAPTPVPEARVVVTGRVEAPPRRRKKVVL